MVAHSVAADALRRVAAGANAPVDESVRAEALRLVLTRFSVSPKYLGGPGPSDEDLAVVALAALRGPDHDKLIPFRFVVARGEGLERLADLFVDYGRRRGKSGDALRAERDRAIQAPVVVAVVARIVIGDADVPPHEQWATIGSAIGNALTALHIMGYAGKMLSGARAADPLIGRAYCKDGEQLVGWMSMGTQTVPARARGEVDPATILSDF
jgi:hypothetical protein